MSDLHDRFTGCLLGLAVGDAIGAPFEGMPATAIWYDFGGARRIVEQPPDLDTLRYTDDTQMCIGVAETLIECGRMDRQVLSARFAANYDPDRGYGQGARRVIEAIKAGHDADRVAETIFPGGSLGNGAAMRVAPIGLLFHASLDRVADEATLSALPTHTHPVGIDGARIMALAVALALAEQPFHYKSFFDVLISYAATDEFRSQLELAMRLSPSDGFAPLGHSLEAHRSVVTAIACFANSPDNYANAISSAIALGDDTDTLAAMAGALAGAHIGIAAIPPHLLDLLEDDTKGRAYMFELADQLYTKFKTSEPKQ